MKYLAIILGLVFLAHTPSRAQVATSLGGGLFQCNTQGTATVTATASSGISGSAQLNCSNPSSSSLLSGATVIESTNTPSVPSSTWTAQGYSLYCAEGFGGGQVGGHSANNCPGGGAQFGFNNGTQGGINASGGHNGGFGIQGVYGADGNIVEYFLTINGPFTDVYISYWDKADSNALYAQSDYFLFDLDHKEACSGMGQDFGYDAQLFNAPGVASTTTTTFIGVSQGQPTNNGACQGLYQYHNTLSNTPINAGTWRQLEIHYHPSTTAQAVADPTNGAPNCNNLSPSAAGCGNGEAELWINGVLVAQSLNANLNGTQIMFPLDKSEIGGTITSFPGAGGGGNASGRCAPTFSTCPGTTPGTGAPGVNHAPFNRYIDDIIVLIK